MKHTKGQWKVTVDSSLEIGVRTEAGFICFLPKPSQYIGQNKRYKQELEEYHANANLISNAPELLEALRDLYDECAILKKQEPLEKQNMLNPKHKAYYDRYSKRMRKAENVIHYVEQTD